MRHLFTMLFDAAISRYGAAMIIDFDALIFAIFFVVLRYAAFPPAYDYVAASCCHARYAAAAAAMLAAAAIQRLILCLRLFFAVSLLILLLLLPRRQR